MFQVMEVRQKSINVMAFRVLVSAYSTHGYDVLFNPPKSTGTFQIELSSLVIINNEVAVKFGYEGIVQISHWRQIYSKHGLNGLLSIQKGRKPNVPKKKTKNIKQQSCLTEKENRLAKLEDQVLRLKIENEALKLLGSFQSRSDKSQK